MTFLVGPNSKGVIFNLHKMFPTLPWDEIVTTFDYTIMGNEKPNIFKAYLRQMVLFIINRIIIIIIMIRDKIRCRGKINSMKQAIIIVVERMKRTSFIIMMLRIIAMQ
jgi:hypothetical protein